MSATADVNYVDSYLPPSIVQELEAGAFQSLCSHLRERSEQVQNIDLMTVSGFCRNCLAKWMVVEARKLSDAIKQGDTRERDDWAKIVQSLDALGYDEAAQHVYGMTYGDWKNRYAKKGSAETMEKYNESKPLWTVYDKDILAKRAETPGEMLGMGGSSQNASAGAPSSLLSNVCCQDVSSPPPVSAPQASTQKGNKSRSVPPFAPPPPPKVSFTMGVLTVSDRASSGEYETGDLSGPAVLSAVKNAIATYGETVTLMSTNSAIVPDEIPAIQSQLENWADISRLNLILTTGGTGFSSRDVTPEATSGVVDRVCDGLVAFCTMECSKIQPLASLSRGTAGVRGNTLIFNLPGNPKGVEEIIPILLPLALHAIADMN